MDKGAESKVVALENTFNKLFEHFSCSVCLSELDNTYITTRCAHRFCEICIKKSVDQFHKCPLCNAYLASYDDLVKDNSFDSLRDEVKVFQEQKMDAVLRKLLDGQATGVNDPNKKFSPLESILKTYLVKSLLVHESYTNQIKAQFFKEVARVDKQTHDFITSLKETCRDKRDLEMKSRIIIENARIEKDELEKDLERQIQSIATKYEKYLEQNKCSPLNLPVKIRVRVMCKNLRFNDLELNSSDDIKVLYEFLVKETEKRSDKIVQFPQDLVIMNFGPFGKYSNEDASVIYENFKTKKTLPVGIDLVNTKHCMPVIEYAVKPESEFILFGKIKFESDLPTVCFKYTFDKAHPKPVDYYQCVTCGLKWICKPCMERCHASKNHEIRVFSLKHNPQWACCFCEKGECLFAATLKA